jgi:hypothetical protein
VFFMWGNLNNKHSQWHTWHIFIAEMISMLHICVEEHVVTHSFLARTISVLHIYVRECNIHFIYNIQISYMNAYVYYGYHTNSVCCNYIHIELM